MDEYAEVLQNVAKSKLKLKTDSDISKKKKKKRSKDKEREKIANTSVDTIKVTGSGEGSGSRFTKAELAFKKQQDAIQQKRIMEKAKMTHKQKVEKFNEHLDSLSEHFDIQKVSWTK